MLALILAVMFLFWMTGLALRGTFFFGRVFFRIFWYMILLSGAMQLIRYFGFFPMLLLLIIAGMMRGRCL